MRACIVCLSTMVGSWLADSHRYLSLSLSLTLTGSFGPCRKVIPPVRASVSKEANGRASALCNLTSACVRASRFSSSMGGHSHPFSNLRSIFCFGLLQPLLHLIPMHLLVQLQHLTAINDEARQHPRPDGGVSLKWYCASGVPAPHRQIQCILALRLRQR